MDDFCGVVIAEGLDNPMLINRLTVYKATISPEGVPIDYDGHYGRWHTYYVRCARAEIAALQPHLLRGWYAHFWAGDTLIVVYNDAQFEVTRGDKSTWAPAVQHGLAQGIPEPELDFLTD